MTTETDPDMAAAELALGLLEGAARAAALRRVLAEPGFAREVAWWRDHFARLFDEYRPVAAPAGLIDDIGLPPVAERRRWSRSIVPLGGAIAAAVVLMMVLRPLPEQAPVPVVRPHAVMLAALAPTEGAFAPIGAAVDIDRGEVRIVASDLAPTDKVAQLWVIRDGVPHAIGLLRRDGATRIAIPAAERGALRAGMVLAVSIEPPGGSPQPTPTGPVVATGTLSGA